MTLLGLRSIRTPVRFERMFEMYTQGATLASHFRTNVCFLCKNALSWGKYTSKGLQDERK